MNIAGTCDSAFDRVRQIFQTNFDEPDELGAAVSIFVDGTSVVDLWGGYTDLEKSKPWKRETIVSMQSTAKQAGCFCVLLLADKEQVDLDAAVAKYWPEFGQAGKDHITVRQVINHLAGIPFLDGASHSSIFEIDAILRAIEGQSPEWTAGTHPFYHSFTIGFILEGLIHRLTGQHIADFWRDNIAAPLQANYQFALNDDELSQCSDFFWDSGNEFVQSLADKETLIGKSWSRALPPEQLFNSKEFRTWGIPNDGHGSPHGLARFCGMIANGGELDGVRLISESGAAQIWSETWNDIDGLLNVPIRYGNGFFLSNETVPLTGGINSCCGFGLGGAIGLIDPELRLGFSYAPNFACESLIKNQAQLLIDACVASIVQGK